MLLMGLQELRLSRGGVGEKDSDCGITMVIIIDRYKLQRQ
jgi:hypothetical protein